jgi:antirestriction protein ArdC
MDSKIEALFAAVTDRIIAALESGVAPWSKPWASQGRHLPWNAATGKTYTGLLNTFLLMVASQGFSSNAWCGMRQANDRFGARLKPGQRSVVSVLFPRFAKRVDAATGVERQVVTGFGARAVFNVDQFDGLVLPEPETSGHVHTPHETAEAIIASMPEPPAFLTTDMDRACYSPLSDAIHLPHVDAFTSSDAFYATKFHEMMHSTGHAKRLAREGITNATAFGSHLYSQEELVAEMGAAYLLALCGIESQVDQNAAYIASWLRSLRNDRTMLYRAALEANKGTRLIAGRFLREQAEAEA